MCVICLTARVRRGVKTAAVGVGANAGARALTAARTAAIHSHSAAQTARAVAASRAAAAVGHARAVHTTAAATASAAATARTPTGGGNGSGLMKALVYHGPGKKSVDLRPIPVPATPTDAVVRLTKTTICGTDLHILKGDVPSCTPGRVLGHEGVGVVHSIGSAVTGLKVGQRVLVSCISSCSKCEFCRKGMYSHCTTGGWVLGNTIDGTQSEFVRIPHAETSLYPVAQSLSPAAEEALVMLSDSLPTAYECGVLNGKVTPGCSVAIVGAGPVGLAALMTAQLYSPSTIVVVDVDPHRLELAKQFGATHTVVSTAGAAGARSADAVAEQVKQATGGRGVDVAIEAVGVPATFELCGNVVAAGGVVANLGVHGVPVDLHLERLWSHNISITTRLVDTVTTPSLLQMTNSKQLDPARLITHRFPFDRVLDAYDTFSRAAENKALKIIIDFDTARGTGAV